MLYSLDLVDYLLDIRQKLLRIVVVQNVHVDSLIAASKERGAILFVLDATADRCED